MKLKENIGQIMHGLSEQDVMSETDEIYQNTATFPRISLMKEATLLPVNKIKNYSLKDNKVILHTEGIYIDEKYTYRYFDYRPVFIPNENVTNIVVQLEFIGEHILRVLAAEGFSAPEHNTPMTAGKKVIPCHLSVKEDNDVLEITNGTITAVIQKDPWNLSIKDRLGNTFYKQFGRDDHSFMPYEICPFGFLYDPVTREKYACEAIQINPYEHFYGLGENFTSTDRKGRAFDLWNTNALGVNTERSYKNIPFYISSNGYGVFCNTSGKIRCDMGQTLSKANSVMIEGDILDLYIIQGNTAKEILPFYYDITGWPALPPKWSFGLWISKISYGTQEEVETVAKHMREMDIPCDVIHIDTDWFTENWVCDWRFDTEKFPDTDSMIKKLHENGYKISLWQLPYVERGKISHEVYDYALQKGYFACDKNGSMKFPHGLIDFTNPEAVTWYKEDLLKPLLKKGIDVIKADFGESAPPFFQYAGADGKEMHNLYSLLYNKAAYEAVLEVLGKENALIWARSAWAGSQQYPVHWGGDAGTDFESLVSSIKGCLNISLSGIPFWSSDIAGFWFSTNPRLYIRWAQFGMFCSHARLHGFYTREPWDYGEEACNIFRKYVKLRYQLLPYLYSQAVKTVKEGMPLHRAMMIDYPKDETVSSIDTQYMFGDSILVAPVIREDDQVKLYLPKGTWTDFHTDIQYSGNQWLEYTAPLDILPLYLKEDAILPMGPSMNYVDERKTDPYTIHLYPIRGKSSFTISEDIPDGKEIKIEMTISDNRIHVSITACDHNFVFVFHNITGKKAIVNEVEWETVVKVANTFLTVSDTTACNGIKIVLFRKE